MNAKPGPPPSETPAVLRSTRPLASRALGAASVAIAAIAVASVVIELGRIVRAIELKHPANGPLVVVDGWGGDGSAAILAFSGAALAVFATQTLGFALIGRAATGDAQRVTSRRGRRLGVLTVALCSAALTAALGTWRCSFSSDVYAYAAYGELARLGASPYEAIPGDPLAAHDALIHAAWTHWPGGPPPCVYGPAFVAVARALVAAAVAANDGANEAALASAITAFRITAVASLAASIVLLGRVLRGRRGSELAIAAFALHPVVIWAALEGHNDALALAPALLGIALVRGKRLARTSELGPGGVEPAAGLGAGLAAAGSALAALAAEVKATALVTLPVAVAASRPGVARRAALAGGALGLAVVLGPGLALQFPAFGHLATHSAYRPTYSLQGLLASLFAGVTRRPIPTPHEVAAAASIALLACAAIAFVATRRLARASRTSRPGDARRSALALFGSAAFLALPNPQPWYAVWFACLAAGTLVRDDGGLEPVALGLWAATFSLALRYLPDAAGALDGPWSSLVVISQLLPIGAALLVETRTAKRFRPLPVKVDA